MTVLPESPVREYAKRIADLMAKARERDPGVPLIWMTQASPWLAGRQQGLSDARAIVAEQAPLPGQETTRFEYQTVGAETDGAPERSEWLDSYDKARSVLLDWKAAAPAFDDLFIERRTVTVTEPVRLGSDGEPVQ